MRVFLGSSGQTLPLLATFLARDPAGLRAAFVPTAARHNEDTSFLDADRAALTDLGVVLEDLDIDRVPRSEAERVVGASDLIFVEGGNSFWLLQAMRETGFDELVVAATASGTPYVGMSAGAVVAGPDLEPLSPISDPSLGPRLQTTRALRLVEFVVIPHYDWEERSAPFPGLVAAYGDRFKLVPLTDRQALVVDDGGPRVLLAP